LTTLAIIGGGIAGRSLIYALAKQEKTFSKIYLFDSDEFAHTCSLRSTAIVAPRGVSSGHSPLGDLIFAAFQTFAAHVKKDSPQGVFSITQYTAALSKLDQFQKRYPNGTLKKDLPHFSFSSEIYLASEAAYLIDPEMYLDWLLKDSEVIVKSDFVTNIQDQKLKTQNGEEFHFDYLVYAGGVHNQNFEFKTKAKCVQGSYLEFTNVDFGLESFSLTLEGDNLIYHAHTKKLLMGSTSLEVHHEWPQMNELSAIYLRLAAHVSLNLPAFDLGLVKTGLREKAPKRTPYLVTEGNKSRIGGFYKNGFSLGLHFGQKLAENLRSKS
jgi:hypothetical protein